MVVISSGTVLILWLRSVNIQSFMVSWRWISLSLGALLWHGWLPLLSGMNRGSPWAESPAEGAGNLLECALGLFYFWVYLRIGSCRWGLMLKVLQNVWQLSLMSGLMGA